MQSVSFGHNTILSVYIHFWTGFGPSLEMVAWPVCLPAATCWRKPRRVCTLPRGPSPSLLTRYEICLLQVHIATCHPTWSFLLKWSWRWRWSRRSRCFFRPFLVTWRFCKCCHCSAILSIELRTDNNIRLREVYDFPEPFPFSRKTSLRKQRHWATVCAIYWQGPWGTPKSTNIIHYKQWTHRDMHWRFSCSILTSPGDFHPKPNPIHL